jgi:hypothetical protein
MIDLDSGDSQGVPTLRVIVNDRKDFAPLRQLVLELSNGGRDCIDVLSDQELFRASASVQKLNLVATPETKKGKVDIRPGISGNPFVRKQPALDWDTALQKLDAMLSGPGHQYFDYRNITIVLSVGEGLSKTAAR